MDLRTDAEKQRAQRHAEICGEYRRIERQNPNASMSRICNAVAEKFAMTAQGVRNIIKKNYATA